MTGIILAAGKSKRMNSDLPKVLLPLTGKPLLYYVLKATKDAGLARILVVVGRSHDQVKKTFADAGVEFVMQNNLLGTADAVKACAEVLSGDDKIMVFCGDTPLLTARTIRRLLEVHQAERADATVLTTVLEDPFGYGRIVRDVKNNQVKAIVEEKEATAEIKKIKEINSGTFAFNWQRLKPVLEEIKPSPRTGEYYLTAAISALKSTGAKIAAYIAPESSEILGINTPEEFDRVAKILAQRNE